MFRVAIFARSGIPGGSGPGGVDPTAPTLSSAVADNLDAFNWLASVSTTESGGTLYWVVTQSGSAPSAGQIKAGLNHLGAAADGYDSASVVASGEQDVSGGGLAQGTTYYVHFVHTDSDAHDSNVITANAFTTDISEQDFTSTFVAISAA